MSISLMRSAPHLSVSPSIATSMQARATKDMEAGPLKVAG